MRVVRLGYFTVSAVSRCAAAAGWYREQGLDVREVPVANSVEQFRLLRDGALDLVVTSPDNVLRYRFRTGNGLGARQDVRIVRPVDRGLGLSLLARPGLRRITDLRGRAIAVDVAGSGFALALIALLADAGLSAQDYQVVELGSTPKRAAALAAGRCDGTLLNAGHELAAEAAGCAPLARVVDRLGPYLGAVLAARADWIDDHPDLVDALLAVWSRATARILDPAARDEQVAQLAGRHGEHAERVLATLCRPDEGLCADPAVPVDALGTVIDLRAAAGGFDPDVEPADVRVGGLGLLDPRCAGA